MGYEARNGHTTSQFFSKAYMVYIRAMDWLTVFLQAYKQ